MAAEFPMPDGVVAKQFDTSTGAIVSGRRCHGLLHEGQPPRRQLHDNGGEDPYAALAQQAAEGRAGYGFDPACGCTTQPAA